MRTSLTVLWPTAQRDIRRPDENIPRQTGMDLPQVCHRMKQRLEPVVVHDAAAAADLRRDALRALLDPAARFGIDRGTVANPHQAGDQVCPALRIDARRLCFAATRTGLAPGI